MPQPAGSKIGPDYARLKTTLANSKEQTENNALHQTILGLIDGVKIFQGFVSGVFNTVNGSLSSLFDTILAIQQELVLRNSTKYSISLGNEGTQTLPDSDETVVRFDNPIFDDGLMQTSPTEITVNASAQYLISGRSLFCMPAAACNRRISVLVNGTNVFNSQFFTEGKAVIPFVSLVELIEGDVVTVSLYQDSGSDLDVNPSIQLSRTSYVSRNIVGFPRNAESFDNVTCDSTPTGGCTDASADYTSLVQIAKDDLIAAGIDLSGSCGAFEITKLVTYRLANSVEPTIGILSKPTGNNCDGYSVDIACFPDGSIYDILGASGEANTPQWNFAGCVDPSRYQAPIAGSIP